MYETKSNQMKLYVHNGWSSYKNIHVYAYFISSAVIHTNIYM